jgi:hypothetical protein
VAPVDRDRLRHGGPVVLKVIHTFTFCAIVHRIFIFLVTGYSFVDLRNITLVVETAVRRAETSSLVVTCADTVSSVNLKYHRHLLPLLLLLLLLLLMLLA